MKSSFVGKEVGGKNGGVPDVGGVGTSDLIEIVGVVKVLVSLNVLSESRIILGGRKYDGGTCRSNPLISAPI